MLHHTIVKLMNLNLFSVPIRRGYIVPTKIQQKETNEVLCRYFDKAKPNTWALESGKTTSNLPGGDNLYEDVAFDWLTLPILNDVKDYWVNTLHYRTDYHMYMDSMWANLHYEGDNTGAHCHVDGRGKSHVSLVYYWSKDNAGGHIQFNNPLEYILRQCPLASSYDDWSRESGYDYDWKTIGMGVHEYVMFPSWLKHRTQPNTKCERIAFSMNFAGFPQDPTMGEWTP